MAEDKENHRVDILIDYLIRWMRVRARARLFKLIEYFLTLVYRLIIIQHRRYGKKIIIWRFPCTPAVSARQTKLSVGLERALHGQRIWIYYIYIIQKYRESSWALFGNVIKTLSSIFPLGKKWRHPIDIGPDQRRLREFYDWHSFVGDGNYIMHGVLWELIGNSNKKKKKERKKKTSHFYY